MHVGTGMFEVL